MSDKKDTSWGKVAVWYDEAVEKPGSYQHDVILPNLLRLIGDTKGKSVLDIACGQGYFSRALAKAGANVTGCDISAELVKIAKEKSKGAKIDFIVSEADNLSFAKKNSFDIALIILAIQNIAEPDSVLKKLKDILKKDGRIYIVMNHPAFRIPGTSSWGFDDAAKVQYRRLDGYMSDSRSKIVIHPGEENSPVTLSFHRPLQVYFKMFRKHGFKTLRLEEWISTKESQAGPRKDAEDRARKEFPMFLALEIERS